MEREVERIQELVRKLMYESEEMERDVKELLDENTNPSEFKLWEKEVKRLQSMLQDALSRMDSLTRRV